MEIHGYFSSLRSDRETSNLDFTVYGEKIREYCFSTPDGIEDTKKHIVLSFYRKDFSPYLPFDMLELQLDKFLHMKDRILIELSFGCIDINLSTGEKKTVSLNTANMNMFKFQSKIFYYENYDIFYYTYEEKGLHIVWIENTETLLNKVRLIEQNGYKGIFIRDVPLALEGNWEALYNIKNSF